MNKMVLKKIIAVIVLIAFIVGVIIMFATGIKHIEDTNGADNYTIQQITDQQIIENKIGSRNIGYHKQAMSEDIVFSSSKFTGVYEILYTDNLMTSDFRLNIKQIKVNSGNFKLVLVYEDKIVETFTPDEYGFIDNYILEDVKGYVSLRAVGESADFEIEIDKYEMQNYFSPANFE